MTHLRTVAAEQASRRGQEVGNPLEHDELHKPSSRMINGHLKVNRDRLQGLLPNI